MAGIYPLLRQANLRAEKELRVVTAESFGVSQGSVEIDIIGFLPVSLGELTLLGVNDVRMISIDMTEEVIDETERYKKSGQVVFPTRGNELDAMTLRVDLVADGSPYVPEELIDEAPDNPGLFFVFPRPNKNKNHPLSTFWNSPFVVTEDTLCNDGTTTPLNNYLARFGITPETPRLKWPQQSPRPVITATDEESISFIARNLVVDPAKSVVRVKD